MMRALLVCTLILACHTPESLQAQSPFKRGDATGDGCVDMFDVNRLFGYLMGGGAAVGEGIDCLAAGDVNDDGTIDVQDITFLINHLTPAPGVLPTTIPAPGPATCGPDPTPGASCLSYTACTPCVVSDCGSFSNGLEVTLPPPCGYVTLGDVLVITTGLPPGSTIEVDLSLRDITGVSVAIGGTFAGRIETFSATMHLDLQGTGGLAGFSRSLSVTAPVEIHSAAQPIGAPPRTTIDCELMALEGQLPGGVDFDLLRVTAGTNLGFPGPGSTTLTPIAAGAFWGVTRVERIFQAVVAVEFVGAPGGALAGMIGTTLGQTLLGLRGTPVERFRRGDVNDDGSVDISDPVALLAVLFGSGPLFSCPDAADVNDDGATDIGDPIAVLNALFASGALPPSPGPSSCGIDPTSDTLDCPVRVSCP